MPAKKLIWVWKGSQHVWSLKFVNVKAKKNVLWGNVKKRTAAIRSQETLFDCLKYVATVLAFDLKS